MHTLLAYSTTALLCAISLVLVWAASPKYRHVTLRHDPFVPAIVAHDLKRSIAIRNKDFFRQAESWVMCSLPLLLLGAFSFALQYFEVPLSSVISLVALFLLLFTIYISSFQFSSYPADIHEVHHANFGQLDWLQFNGHAQIPSRVYQDDSRIISIELAIENSASALLYSGFFMRNSLNDSSLSLTALAAIDDMLELELVAGGCDIAGALLQCQRLEAKRLYYQWSCHFAKSGTHEIALIARQITREGKVHLGRIEHSIRVTKLGPLTQRQVWVLATTCALAAGSIAVAKTLHDLGLL